MMVMPYDMGSGESHKGGHFEFDIAPTFWRFFVLVLSECPIIVRKAFCSCIDYANLGDQFIFRAQTEHPSFGATQIAQTRAHTHTQWSLEAPFIIDLDVTYSWIAAPLSSWCQGLWFRHFG